MACNSTGTFTHCIDTQHCISVASSEACITESRIAVMGSRRRRGKQIQAANPDRGTGGKEDGER